MSRQDVLAASARFYDALNRMANGSTGTMDQAWSQGDSVTAMHPVGGRETGWKAVASSFDQVAQAATDGKIDLQDQNVEVGGDMAYEIGVEKGSFTFAGQQVDIEQRVTNVYRRENGEWKLVHHHADISPAMIEIVERL